ncbi:MAG: PilZ domain-containing protein [Planctomycetota bacterium]
MKIRLTEKQLDGCIDTLKLSDEEWIKLVKELGDNTSGEPFASKRVYERITYCDMVRAICEVQHPGGNIARFSIRTRDLSASGIGFFHGQYLYPESRCTVLLMAQDTGLTRLGGTVKRCDLVQGRVHMIGIAFDNLIEPERFTGRVAPLSASGPH